MRENLSRDQREQYAKHRYFDVIGGNTGTRYRIAHGVLMNVTRLNQDGRPVGRLCFFPQGLLVWGDVMLAQKLALELFEWDTLAVANKFPAEHGRAHRR